MSDWGLSYGTKEEFDFRFNIYFENDKMLDEMNAESNSFEVEHNMFSTMTEDEQKKYLGYIPPPDESEEVETEILDT